MTIWRKQRKGWWLYLPTRLDFVYSVVLRKWCVVRHPEIRANSRREALEEAQRRGIA